MTVRGGGHDEGEQPGIADLPGYGLEIRGPESLVDPPSKGDLFEWRIIDTSTQRTVLAGKASTLDLAIREGLAQAWANLHVSPSSPVALPPGAAEEGAAAAPSKAPIALVRALAPRVDSLPSVSGSSAALLAQALVEAEADAGAVLVGDGDAWWVTAGSGLRQLEYRCVLNTTHWLVGALRTEGDGVLVTDADSDTVRLQLTGAPLAGSRHLMAVPLTSADGILLLAREDDPPFDRNDLERITRVGRKAAAALAEAVELRTLARALGRYTDPAS